MFTVFHKSFDYYEHPEPMHPYEQEIIISNVVRLLAYRCEIDAASWLSSGVVHVEISSAIGVKREEFSTPTTVIIITAPIDTYHYLKRLLDDENSSIRNDFEAIASAFYEFKHYISFIDCELETVEPPEDWKNRWKEFISPSEVTPNQALFTYPDAPKFVHEQLNFRSKTEIKIYESLVSRGLLIFPLPVAVMGYKSDYLEPDFVVIHNGKAGILDVQGDSFHPPQTAAKEHERRRRFTKLGIEVYEIFAATRCWSEPEKVVDDFLRAFNS